MSIEERAEEYATRECCTTCKNINHFCKEKCECWTFARKGAEFGFKEALKMKVNITTISDAPLREDDISTVLFNSDKRLEPVLQKLKDLGVIKSWYFNGTYHAE